MGALSGETPVRSPVSMHRRTGLAWCAKWTGFIVVLLFLAYRIAQNWHAMGSLAMPGPWWLLAGSALGIGGMMATAWTLHGLLLAHGARVSFPKSVGLCFVPMLGRYVPGRVGAIVLALYFYRRQSIERATCLACVVSSMALGAMGTCLVVVAASLGRRDAPRDLWSVLGLLGVLAVAMHPRFFRLVARWASRRIGHGEVSAVGYSVLFRGVGRSFLSMLLTGGGFLFFARAFVPFNPADAPTLIASFACAQVAGLVAVFAPAGLGVRENVLLLGISPVVGPGPAIAITLSCRLWQTVLELIMAVLGWISIRSADRMTLVPERVPA